MATTLGLYDIAQGAQLVPDGVTRWHTIQKADGTPMELAAWQYAYVLLNLTVGAGGTVTGTIQLSYDGVNWFDTYLHSLVAAQNKWTLAANIAFNASVAAAVLAISNPAPYLRFGAIAAVAGALINDAKLITVA